MLLRLAVQKPDQRGNVLRTGNTNFPLRCRLILRLIPQRERFETAKRFIRRHDPAVFFKKAAGILGGLWEKVQERPEAFLEPRAIAADGLDAATKDFLAGMTDRYAVGLFERLFIPKPWVGPLNEGV